MVPDKWPSVVVALTTLPKAQHAIDETESEQVGNSEDLLEPEGEVNPFVLGVGLEKEQPNRRPASDQRGWCVLADKTMFVKVVVESPGCPPDGFDTGIAGTANGSRDAVFEFVVRDAAGDEASKLHRQHVSGVAIGHCAQRSSAERLAFCCVVPSAATEGLVSCNVRARLLRPGACGACGASERTCADGRTCGRVVLSRPPPRLIRADDRLIPLPHEVAASL